MSTWGADHLSVPYSLLSCGSFPKVCAGTGCVGHLRAPAQRAPTRRRPSSGRTVVPLTHQAAGDTTYCQGNMELIVFGLRSIFHGSRSHGHSIAARRLTSRSKSVSLSEPLCRGPEAWVSGPRGAACHCCQCQQHPVAHLDNHCLPSQPRIAGLAHTVTAPALPISSAGGIWTTVLKGVEDQ